MDVLAFFRSAEVEPYLHGTRHTLQPGQVLEGGSVRSNQGNGTPGQHVYFTRLHDVAKEFAEAGYGPDHDLDAKPRVYHVEPLDDVEPDPDEDPEVQSFRSRRVRVVREAAKATQAPSSVLSDLGYTEDHSAPGRMHPIAHQTGEGMLLPTPSPMNPEPRGYRPGDDLSTMDKSPHVGWVRTEALLKHREYDRAGADANPDSRERIDQIRREFRDHGQREPVVLMHDPHSDRAYLGEGNHRLAAAVEEGVPALAVHVTRAFRHEGYKMAEPRHYLGSHRVMADKYGYTPSSMAPKDALPDHYLYTGGKTAAVWEHPEPQYDSGADYETNRGQRDSWRHETRKALSRGELTNDQAIANGYHGIGHDHGEDSVFGPRTLGWKPLPHDLYHVTTDLKSTLTHGLKSRRELGQSQGKGLGGGEDDTISFTDNEELAHHILHSMREFHDVANGRKTPAHMWDEAQQGTDAARPFHHELEKALGNRWTGGIHPGLRGQTVLSRGGTTPPEPGCEPWSNGDHIDTQKGTFHTHWVRPMTDDEKREHAVDFYKGFARMREAAGGRPDPVFFSSDVSGFAKMDPKNFGIVRARPKPKAAGYQMGSMGEWRTCDGSAVDLTHHKTARWLPHDRIFGPGHGGLDPRLFDERKKMRPEVAGVILGDLDAYWHPTYPDWREWTRVYLAGSEASEWYGNNDFDTLLGVEHKRLRRAHPEFADMLDDDIDAYLTSGLREHLNNEDWIAPWDGEVWHRTYYVNPNSWDIRDIKPYAAYDITRARWIVEPVHPAADWGPEKLPAAFWDEAESIVKQVHAIEAMPEPMRTGRGAALFDYLHGDRRRAFGPHGTGVYDPGNATWKYLDMHPDHPLAALVDLKRKYENELAAGATA